MTKVAFVTDSTANLTPEQMTRYGFTVVPLSVMFGDEAYQEGVDIDTKTFYTRLTTSKVFPTSSQPAIGLFLTTFERLLRTHDVVLCLLLSSNLSGTYQTAMAAANMVDGNIIVVDSKITSFGIAGPLIEGAELIERGGSVEDVLKLWESELKRMHAYFVLDTLDSLHRGGRIGGAAAVFGSLLQIKPILTLVDGRIELFEKVRTHRRAMERAMSKFDELASTGVPIKFSVVHSQRFADADDLEAQLSAKYPNAKGEVCELSPVIGTHAGSGLLAFIFYEMKPDKRQ